MLFRENMGISGPPLQQASKQGERRSEEVEAGQAERVSGCVGWGSHPAVTPHAHSASLSPARGEKWGAPWVSGQGLPEGLFGFFITPRPEQLGEVRAGRGEAGTNCL